MKNFVLNYSLEQLSLLCLYPDVKTLKFKICGVLVCCYYASSWIFNVISIFTEFNGLDSIQQAMVSIPSVQQLLFKTVFMFFTKAELVNVIKNIRYLQSTKVSAPSRVAQDKINNADRKFTVCFKIYKRIILMTSYIFIFKPLLSSGRHFPIGWYTPCDPSNNYCYALWYIWESGYALFAQYTIASMDSLYFAIIFTVYSEIAKLKDCFENLKTNNGIVSNAAYGELGSCVDRHNLILEVLKDVNSVFEYQLLNQFLTSIVTICFGIYYLNASYPPHLELIPYLLVYHNQLFMYCFAGEMIQRQVSSVDLAVYNVKWYCVKRKDFIRCLKLVIQRSQKPVSMSIGQIWKLDLKTFIGVLRTSFSIHTFLQAINK